MSDASDTAGAEEQIPVTEENNEIVEFSRESLDAEQREKILAGEGAEVFDAHQQAKAEETDGEEPQTEDESVDNDSANAEEDDTEDVIKMPKLRVTPKDADELKFMDLVKKGMSIPEATREVYGESANAPKENEAESPQDLDAESSDEVLQEFETSVENAESQLKELEDRLADANEAEDVAESNRLTREIVNKELEIKELKAVRDGHVRETEQQEADKRNVKIQESADRAYERFPTLADEKSKDRAEFIEYYNEKAKDPDYADIFKSPMWAQILASEFAVLKGLRPAGEKPSESATPPAKDATDSKQTPKAPMPKRAASKQNLKTPAAKTLTSGDGHQDGSIQVSRSTYSKDRSNMTLEEKKRLLSNIPVHI